MQCEEARAPQVMRRQAYAERGVQTQTPQCAVAADLSIRGISSFGRAPALQAGGGRFEPGMLHHTTVAKIANALGVSAEELLS